LLLLAGSRSDKSRERRPVENFGYGTFDVPERGRRRRPIGIRAYRSRRREDAARHAFPFDRAFQHLERGLAPKPLPPAAHMELKSPVVMVTLEIIGEPPLESAAAETQISAHIAEFSVHRPSILSS
jgi:hypothetical protein